MLTFTSCSRRASLAEVSDQSQLVDVKPILAICDAADGGDELLEEDIPVNSLVHATKHDALHVAELMETNTDHMPVTLSCAVGEFDHFEEVQER